MKNILKITAIMLIVAGSFYSCGKKGEAPVEPQTDLVDPKEEEEPGETYYVVGYDGAGVIVDIQKGTAKSGAYLFISEENKNLSPSDNILYSNILAALDFRMIDDGSYIVGELLDGIIDFPRESMTKNYCVYTLFPEKYRFAFKVQMTYRPMTQEELNELNALVERRVLPTVCANRLRVASDKHVVITSISKIE